MPDLLERPQSGVAAPVDRFSPLRSSETGTPEPIFDRVWQRSLVHVTSQSVPKDRFRALVEYLGKLSAGSAEHRLIDPKMVHRALVVWLCLRRAVGSRLPVPDASPGPDGSLLYTWDWEGHHLELELFSDAPAEFFYTDRASGAVWEQDWVISEPLPEGATGKFQLFM